MLLFGVDKKCYKQTYIALAIKKVRFCLGAKDAEHNISTEMAKTSRAYKGTNVGNVALDSFGQAIYQEEISLAAL